VTGTWAAQIGAGDYAYLEAGRLVRRLPDGSDVAVDNGVVDAAVSPDDSRLAYVVTTPSGAEIRGYDLGLRAHYRIAAESGPVTALVWSASGNRVAYLLGSPLAGDRELRVRPLSGSGTPVTVARGDIADPRWLGGGDDLVFAAEVATASGLQSRIFRVSLAAPLTGTLSAAGSLATGLDAAMSSPRPSLDGHQVAVLVGEPESAQVWVMNSDGTGLHRLTAYDADSFPFVCRDLHWAT
jgi:Tol biopolymer transport system component